MTRLERAKEQYLRGDPDGAADELEALLEAEPGLTEPQVLLARCYSRMRQPADAVAELDEVLAREPGHPEALALRGAEHYFEDELDEAEEKLKQALAAQPGLVEAQVRLAQVHTDRKEFDDAEAVLAAGVETAADNADDLALVRMGQVYLAMQRRDSDGALTIISENEHLWEGRPYVASTVRSNQAIIYARRRDYGQAKELLIDALDLDPYFHMARGLLGQVALLQKDYQLAADQLQQVVENGDEVSAYAYYSLGASLQALKRPLEALPYYQAALDRGLSGFPAVTARVAVAIPDVNMRYALLAVFVAALAWLALRVFSPLLALALVAVVGVFGFQIVRGGR